MPVSIFNASFEVFDPDTEILATAVHLQRRRSLRRSLLPSELNHSSQASPVRATPFQVTDSPSNSPKTYRNSPRHLITRRSLIALDERLDLAGDFHADEQKIKASAVVPKVHEPLSHETGANLLHEKPRSPEICRPTNNRVTDIECFSPTIVAKVCSKILPQAPQLLTSACSETAFKSDLPGNQNDGLETESDITERLYRSYIQEIEAWQALTEDYKCRAQEAKTSASSKNAFGLFSTFNFASATAWARGDSALSSYGNLVNWLGSAKEQAVLHTTMTAETSQLVNDLHRRVQRIARACHCLLISVATSLRDTQRVADTARFCAKARLRGLIPSMQQQANFALTKRLDPGVAVGRTPTGPTGALEKSALDNWAVIAELLETLSSDEET